MSEVDRSLAHALMVRFGTGNGEPTDAQLTAIKKELATLIRKGSTPTDEEWRRAVHRYCPTAGKWKYAGVDNSDLNALLIRALSAVK